MLTVEATTTLTISAAEEVGKRLVHGGEDKTDWNRVKAMSQAEIESLADD